jgi:hypothetical protein
MRRYGVLPVAALLAALTACQADSPGDEPAALTQRPAASHDLADAFQSREGVGTDLGRVPVDWPWKNELDPRALDCPNDRAVFLPGGLLTGTPAGYDTPERAVEAWLEQRQWVGLAYEVAPSGSAARILRPDGTVRAQVQVVTSRGYIVQGSVACIEPQ